jgi:hypothetical protein
MYDPKAHEEFEARITAKYGNMFHPRLGGFAIGPGWYHIVEELCSNIAWHLKYLRDDVRPDFKVVQVKEKFAGLRFYADNADATIDGMIYMAESWADKSCEVCGNRGTRRNTGWLRTLCDEHAEETENENSDCE